MEEKIKDKPWTNKIPPLALTVLLGALMVPLSWLSPHLPIDMTARVLLTGALAIPGMLIVGLGVAGFRLRRTTVNPLKPETSSALVTTGVYGISRNPMYLGFALGLAGWSTFLASPYALLLSLGFAIYIDRFQIAPEEVALAKLFGDQFSAYKARVRRWL